MRRTNPFEPLEPIEPAEPLWHAIKGQHAPWTNLIPMTGYHFRTSGFFYFSCCVCYNKVIFWIRVSCYIKEIYYDGKEVLHPDLWLTICYKSVYVMFSDFIAFHHAKEVVAKKATTSF